MTAVCGVEGCGSQVHGRSLCRAHYDEQRYLATTGRDPEVKARASREHWIESELRYGSVPDWASPHGTGSMFATHEERRAAWEERRGPLMAEYAEGSGVGHRPWAWWHYFAEREQHVISYDDQRDARKGKSTEEQPDLYDEYQMEPVLFLASIGRLRHDEVEKLKADADEAGRRIGTSSERIGSGGVDRADRRRVKLLEAVRAAMSDGAEA